MGGDIGMRTMSRRRSRAGEKYFPDAMEPRKVLSSGAERAGDQDRGGA